MQENLLRYELWNIINIRSSLYFRPITDLIELSAAYRSDWTFGRLQIRLNFRPLTDVIELSAAYRSDWTFGRLQI
jgi:hypothetical protein